jgi:hypothetical protein
MSTIAEIEAAIELLSPQHVEEPPSRGGVGADSHRSNH